MPGPVDAKAAQVRSVEVLLKALVTGGNDENSDSRLGTSGCLSGFLWGRPVAHCPYAFPLDAANGEAIAGGD